MSDLVVAAALSRAELDLEDLVVEDPSAGYEVVQYGVGALSWRRHTVSSPFLPDILVAAVKETRVQTLAVQVKGATANQFNTRLQALLRALEQFRYILTISLDGVILQYGAEPADYVPGSAESLNKYELMVYQQTVWASIPTAPVPYLGGI